MNHIRQISSPLSMAAAELLSRVRTIGTAGHPAKIDNQMINDIREFNKLRNEMARECAMACIRAASLDIFSNNQDVHSVTVEASWDEAETDDEPWVYIQCYGADGRALDEDHQDLESSIESMVWGVLSQHELEAYFKLTTVYRDGRLEQSLDHRQERKPS